MRSIGQDTKPIKRREAIEACVRAWIRNNPEEFTKFKDFMGRKRVGLADKKFGRVKEDSKTAMEEMRLVGSIPQSLSKAINELCWFHGQRSLFQHGTKEDKDAESQWFFKKFNVFRVSEKL